MEGVPNKVGMRPIDVSWTTMPLAAYYAWDSRIMIRRLLLRVGAPYGENDRGDLFRKKCVLNSKKKKRPLQPRRRRGEEDVGESNSCSTSSSPFLRSHYNRDICIRFYVARRQPISRRRQWWWCRRHTGAWRAREELRF